MLMKLYLVMYYTAVQKYGVGKIYFNALEWTHQKPHLFDQK